MRHEDFDKIFRQYAKRFGEPYPNEHACRLVDPSKLIIVGSGERDHEGKKYRVIFGRPKDDGGTVEQAYRYPKDTWTVEQARVHCQDHKGIEFSPATGEAESETKKEYAIWRFVAYSDTKVCEDCAKLQARLFTCQGIDEDLKAMFPYGEGTAYEFKPNVHPNCRCRLVRLYAGEAYREWLNSFDPPLDDSKPLPNPLPHRKGESIAPAILECARKEQGDTRTYLVTALHVGSTGRPDMIDPDGTPRWRHYTEDELLRSARTLVGKGGGINHEYYVHPPEFDVKWSEYDTDSKAIKAIVDCFDGVINNLYDAGSIVHASVEYIPFSSPRVDGVVPFGIIFSGLHFLTNDVRPGDPKTQVQLISNLVKPPTATAPAGESAEITSKEVKEEMSEKKETDEYEKVLREQLSTADENNLPDSAFAYIAPGGKKDDQGKTVPRSLRKLPHHNPNGDVDVKLLQAALRYLPKTDLPASAVPEVRAHLIAHAKDVLPSYQSAAEELAKIIKEFETPPDRKIEAAPGEIKPEEKKTEITAAPPAATDVTVTPVTVPPVTPPPAPAPASTPPQETKPPEPKTTEQKPPEEKKEAPQGVGWVGQGEDIIDNTGSAQVKEFKHKELLKNLPKVEDITGRSYGGAYVRRIIETVRKELEGETA